MHCEIVLRHQRQRYVRAFERHGDDDSEVGAYKWRNLRMVTDRGKVVAEYRVRYGGTRKLKSWGLFDEDNKNKRTTRDKAESADNRW